LAAKQELEEMLSGSVSYEKVMELDCVGVAGAANAGKSSLVNALLGKKRSIVSGVPRTTRDVLTGELELKDGSCVLFDCAGLVIETTDIIDSLAQSAAAAAIANADAVVFCVDITKPNVDEDRAIYKKANLDDRGERVIAVATKADMCGDEDEINARLDELRRIFGVEFTAVSVKQPASVENLKRMIDGRLVELSAGGGGKTVEANPAAVLTARHVRALTEAADNIEEAAGQVQSGDDEVAAMYIRFAIEALAPIEAENIDEQVLSNIFRKFCIGK